MNKEKKYDEPEIVGGASDGQKTTRGNIEDVFREYANEGMGQAQKNLLWAAFWPVVGTLFIFFLVVGLVITVLFWLLPFAFAAFIVAVIFFGGLTLVRGIIGMFKK